MILLDTQVLVWSAFADARLGERGRRIIAADEGDDTLYMSPVSAWEISMLADKGRLRLSLSVQDWIAGAARGHNVRWTDLTPDVAANAGSLPGRLHGDPADRLIIATALSRNLTLMTADRRILDCAKMGHIQVIDARL